MRTIFSGWRGGQSPHTTGRRGSRSLVLLAYASLSSSALSRKMPASDLVEAVATRGQCEHVDGRWQGRPHGGEARRVGSSVGGAPRGARGIQGLHGVVQLIGSSAVRRSDRLERAGVFTPGRSGRAGSARPGRKKNCERQRHPPAGQRTQAEATVLMEVTSPWCNRVRAVQGRGRRGVLAQRRGRGGLRGSLCGGPHLHAPLPSPPRLTPPHPPCRCLPPIGGVCQPPSTCACGNYE